MGEWTRVGAEGQTVRLGQNKSIFPKISINKSLPIKHILAIFRKGMRGEARERESSGLYVKILTTLAVKV